VEIFFWGGPGEFRKVKDKWRKRKNGERGKMENGLERIKCTQMGI
jgi:hypothetical protein